MSEQRRQRGSLDSRVQSDEQKRNDGQQDGFGCKLVTCPLDELRTHPSYVRHQLSVSASQLSSLIALGRLAFREPIVITRKGIILDGYARWELARRQGRQTILCLEHDLTEEEALRWLIQSHRPSRGLNAFCRTLLALDLELSLREQARANQRAGGQNKNASNLTEAKRLDVRSEVAAAGGVSTGNVTKVSQLTRMADPKVEQAVRAGQISIHKAWQWSRLSPPQQLRELGEYQSRKGTNQTSRRLVRKHVARLSPTQLIPTSLGDLLKSFVPDRSALLDSIVVTEVDAPGNVAYLTKDALRTLRSIEESKCQN
jgi:hypothetical protein